MTEICTMDHVSRPWWKRRVLWFIGIAAVSALLIGIAVEEAGKSAPTPYSAFLDQLEAGNVASVTLQGTAIDARLKHPLDSAPAGGKTLQDIITSRVPDFGDPTLIQELRKRHVTINVTMPSAWTWLFGRIPWPMLIFVGAMLVAGIVRLVRGGRAQSGAGGSMPMHGMVGLVSGLFAKHREAATPPTQDSEQPTKTP